MKIAVCVKQVPDTADIKWTEQNTIQREGLESIINPFDMYALETALKLKDIIPDVSVTAVTMGPIQAIDVIRKAVSMGVDEGFVLSDKKFAGSDTIATGKTLATAIKIKIPDVDLVLCGQLAIDGDTAQTGPTIANNLGFSQVTYVKEILDYKKDSLIVKREIEDGWEILDVKLPAVLCMLKCDYEPRRSLINGFISAQKIDIPIVSMEDIGLTPESIGIKGSPTCVSKAFRPESVKNGKIIVPENPENAADIILEALYEK